MRLVDGAAALVVALRLARVDPVPVYAPLEEPRASCRARDSQDSTSTYLLPVMPKKRLTVEDCTVQYSTVLVYLPPLSILIYFPLLLTPPLIFSSAHLYLLMTGWPLSFLPFLLLGKD